MIVYAYRAGAARTHALLEGIANALHVSRATGAATAVALVPIPAYTVKAPAYSRSLDA